MREITAEESDSPLPDCTVCSAVSILHPYTNSFQSGFSVALLNKKLGFPGSSGGKESTCNEGDPVSIPGFWKIPWRKKWQPTPVFLPEKSHGQRSVVGYSTKGCKELDVTE